MHRVEFEGIAGGPRVVYVHGLGGSLVNWAELAPRLSGQVRATAIDLPGFGRTPAQGRRTTVAANAAALADFLREQVKEPCILVGNSMGGYISIIVAARHPDLVSGLVLIDPALPLARGARLEPAVGKQFFLHGVPGLGEWLLARRYARVPARVRVTEVMERCCHDLTRVSPDLLEQLIALEEELTLQPRHAADHLAAARSIVRGLARPAAYWRLTSGIEKPVLLLHGKHDRLVSIASAYQAAKRNPQWTFVELEAGHVPMMETPDLVAEEMVKWLNGLKA